MNAMIFAAGLGTRLQPLTNHKPKALVEFKGKPLLWHAIHSVVNAGARRVVINVHHYADQIINYINEGVWNCEVLISDERNYLLETGGGLIKARDLFIPNQAVLLQNADVLVSVNLIRLIEHHVAQHNNATLMVKDRKTSRYLLFDKDQQLCGWRNTMSSEEIIVKEAVEKFELGFCGIHILDYELIKEMGDKRPISIVKNYLELAKNHRIGAFQLKDSDKWFDVGSLEKLKEAELNY